MTAVCFGGGAHEGDGGTQTGNARGSEPCGLRVASRIGGEGSS